MPIDDVCVSVLVPKTKEIYSFAKMIKDRVNKLHLIQNVKVLVKPLDEKTLFIVYFTPMIKTLSIYIYMSVLIGGLILIFQWFWLLWSFAVMIPIAFLQSEELTFILLYKGLRKYGVKGKIKFILFNKEVIRRLI